VTHPPLAEQEAQPVAHASQVNEALIINPALQGAVH